MDEQQQQQQQQQEPSNQDPVQPEPVATTEGEAPASEPSSLAEVALTADQWSFVHGSLQWSLALSLASLIFVCAIFGAMLSHYLGRAVNRG